MRLRRILVIVGSLALLARIAVADAGDDQFRVVKICYTGDKSVVKVLDGKQYKKLNARMNAGGATHAFSGEADNTRLVPKWLILQGTFPTREAAEDMLRGKRPDPDEAAEKKARAEKLLQVQALTPRHAPAEYDKEKADESKKELEKIRNSLKTDSKIPCKHALGDPLTDTLVDINKPLITTDIHKLDTVKVDRGGAKVTAGNNASK